MTRVVITIATVLFWWNTPLEQRLQDNNESNVQEGEQSSQAAIHQGTVDQQVDVVESIPQNWEPNGERDQEKYDGEEEIKDDSKTLFTQRILVLERCEK